MRTRTLLTAVGCVASLAGCAQERPEVRLEPAAGAMQPAEPLPGMYDQVFATDAGRDVRIVLFGVEHPVSLPTIVYQVPGLPGDIRSPMAEDGAGNYELVVPARSARPGTWRYAIEVPMDGRRHRLPTEGFRSFRVQPARHAAVE